MATFGQQVEATIPALRRYARALTRDSDIADDLVQDTMVRALRSEHLFHGGEVRIQFRRFRREEKLVFILRFVFVAGIKYEAPICFVVVLDVAPDEIHKLSCKPCGRFITGQLVALRQTLN